MSNETKKIGAQAALDLVESLKYDPNFRYSNEISPKEIYKRMYWRMGVIVMSIKEERGQGRIE